MATDQSLSDIYDEWIPPSSREKQRTSRTLENYRYCANEVLFLIQHFRLPPHLIKVLDYGFGWAEWAHIAAAMGCAVAGVELSRERREYARSIGINVIEFDALPTNTFHFINTEQVFEHVTEPKEVLIKLKQAVVSRGIIKVSVPDAKRALKRILRAGFSGLSQKEILPVAPLEHINSFEYRSLVSLGRSIGLKPLCPNLRLIYDSSSGWFGVKRAARLLIRPIYRFVFPRTTFVYFVNDSY